MSVYLEKGGSVQRGYSRELVTEIKHNRSEE